MGFVSRALWILAVAALLGCGDTGDDLYPSGEDKRPAVQEGTTGPEAGQLAPDFTVPDSLGEPFTLSKELGVSGVNGVVLYFTMWCATCDREMNDMKDKVIPAYPDVTFLAVDFVSGNVADARSLQLSGGFASAFRVLVDLDGAAESAYRGTMGSTVVVDRNGVVRMNESYNDGSRLADVLSRL